MSPQVAVALISSGAAVLVALLGIAGTIAAQIFATRRAFDNSLALLERQLAQSNEAAEQERASRERERREQARREDAYRYAEERRILYAKFLRLSGASKWASWNVQAQHDPGPDASEESKERYKRALEYWMKQDDELGEQLAVAASEVRVIAASEVRIAAEEMLGAKQLIAGGTYERARNKFLIAVHSELGVDREPPWRIESGFPA
jgi:hypothetical protein